MNYVLANWQTTVTGVLTILGIITAAAIKMVDGDPETNPDWGTIIPGIIAAIGLITARDAGRSSRSLGID